MSDNNNNLKVMVAIVGFIIVIYFANVRIKNIKQNKDKATIENAKKYLIFLKEILLMNKKMNLYNYIGKI